MCKPSCEGKGLTYILLFLGAEDPENSLKRNSKKPGGPVNLGIMTKKTIHFVIAADSTFEH